MTVKYPVATPTPHYDYTVRHNRHIEEVNHQRKVEHVKANQVKWEDYYSEKRKRIEDAHRIDRALQRKHELEQIHQYEVLANKHSYAEYRYMFYVGTKFDAYI